MCVDMTEDPHTCSLPPGPSTFGTPPHLLSCTQGCLTAVSTEPS